MTNLDVCKAFVKGKSAKSLNMRTDGNRIWSYSTVLAQWADGNKLIVNPTKYSLSTSKQQTYLKRAIYDAPFIVEELTTTNNVPFGTQDLKKYIK